MKAKNKIEIILAETDVFFRTRLNTVLIELATSVWGNNFVIYEAVSCEEIKKQFSSSTNLVLIDSSLFLKENEDFFIELYAENKTCSYVFLISTHDEFRVKTLIQIINNNKNLSVLEFIIKTNSPIGLIYVILSNVINRVKT